MSISTLNRLLEATIRAANGTIGAYTPTITDVSYLEMPSLTENLRHGEPLLVVATELARGAIGSLMPNDTDLWPIHRSLLGGGWAFAAANYVGLFQPGLLQASLWPERYRSVVSDLESESRSRERSRPAHTYSDDVTLAKLHMRVALDAASAGDSSTMGRSLHRVPALPRGVFERQIDLDSMARDTVGNLHDRHVDSLVADVKDAVRRAVDGKLEADEAVHPSATARSLDVLFIAQNGAQAREMIEMAHKLDGPAVGFLALDAVTSDQGASQVLAEGNFDVLNEVDLLGSTVVSQMVVGYPRDPLVDELIESAIKAGASVYEIGSPETYGILRVDEGPDQPAGVVTLSAPDLLPLLSAASMETSAQIAIAPGPTRADVAFRRDESMDKEWDDKEIRRFHNIHAGERCVIIGNGPSLNQLDLHKLAGEYTIGVNGIFYAAEAMGFDPTYYVVEDSMVVKDNLVAIQEYSAGHKFFPAIYRDLISKSPNVTFFNLNQAFYLKSSPAYCIPRFSTDAASRLFSGQSVTIVNLQLAYYMGFTEVILIGMDFSYSLPDTSQVTGNHILSQGDDPNHFHPDYFGKGKVWKDPKLDRVLASYQLAKQMFEADGRRILNATAGGNLHLFERANYDSLFARRDTR
jgi:hypothetical protein